MDVGGKNMNKTERMKEILKAYFPKETEDTIKRIVEQLKYIDYIFPEDDLSVGDEVSLQNGDRVIIGCVTRVYGGVVTALYGNGCITTLKDCRTLVKTGRHYEYMEDLLSRLSMQEALINEDIIRV